MDDGDMTKKDTNAGKQARRPAPKLTPEVVTTLAEESRALRRDLRRRVARMWSIPADQRQARSR
jgi:hypothetical protein